jgi:hypothetical protein
MIDRREFMKAGGAFALAAHLNGFTAQTPERETMQTNYAIRNLAHQPRGYLVLLGHKRTI